MNAILKYSLLSTFEKKEVNDFIEFLFSKKDHPGSYDPDTYKNKILSVSTWSDDDLKIFEDNNKLFNQWRPETW